MFFQMKRARLLTGLNDLSQLEDEIFGEML
jgi:hypothetical protein